MELKSEQEANPGDANFVSQITFPEGYFPIPACMRKLNSISQLCMLKLLQGGIELEAFSNIYLETPKFCFLGKRNQKWDNLVKIPTTRACIQVILECRTRHLTKADPCLSWKTTSLLRAFFSKPYLYLEAAMQSIIPGCTVLKCGMRSG